MFPTPAAPRAALSSRYADGRCHIDGLPSFVSLQRSHLPDRQTSPATERFPTQPESNTPPGSLQEVSDIEAFALFTLTPSVLASFRALQLRSGQAPRGIFSKMCHTPAEDPSTRLRPLASEPTSPKWPHPATKAESGLRPANAGWRTAQMPRYSLSLFPRGDRRACALERFRPSQPNLLSALRAHSAVVAHGYEGRKLCRAVSAN